MNAWQKIVSASLAGIIWCAAIVAKHFWADIDISGISAACSGVLSGLGVYHTMQAGKTNFTQPKQENQT